MRDTGTEDSWKFFTSAMNTYDWPKFPVDMFILFFAAAAGCCYFASGVCVMHGTRLRLDLACLR